VYTDGDVEVLMLKKEQWESAESDPENDGVGLYCLICNTFVVISALIILCI